MTTGDKIGATLGLLFLASLVYFTVANIVYSCRTEFDKQPPGMQWRALTFQVPTLTEQCDHYEKWLREELARVEWIRRRP